MKFDAKPNSVRTSGGLRRGQGRAALLLGGPAIILVTVFLVVPFVMSVGFSFTNKMLVQNPNNPLSWVGFYNYIKMFNQEETVRAVANTFIFAIMVVPVTVFVATLLAVSVNTNAKGIGFFRLVYFSPQVVSTIVVAIIWWFVFSPSEEGLLNSILNSFGMGRLLWLKDPGMALPCIAFMTIWQGLGMQMLIILGGLQFIPHELYEAAEIDGCSKPGQFRRITLPMLKNTLNFVTITTTISALKLFTQVFVLTDGGPRNSTLSIVYQVYTSGFIKSQLGYASAISVVFFITVLAISLVQNKINSKD